MSFNLPRNSRDLRFTGELRAAEAEQPAGRALGRVRRTPVPGRRSDRDVYKAEPIATPYLSGPPAASIDILDLEDLVEDDDYDDDAPTTMLDRDGLDVLPGGFSAVGSPSRPQPPATAPIPNFRRMPETPSVIVAPEPLPRPAAPPQRNAPPLAFWLLAAMLAAVVSYRVAPLAVNQADSVVRLLEPHGSAPQE